LEKKTIITPPEALKHVPQGVHDILLLVKDNTSATTNFNTTSGNTVFPGYYNNN
jgi:hypothetical protein